MSKDRIKQCLKDITDLVALADRCLDCGKLDDAMEALETGCDLTIRAADLIEDMQVDGKELPS